MNMQHLPIENSTKGRHLAHVRGADAERSQRHEYTTLISARVALGTLCLMLILGSGCRSNMVGPDFKTPEATVAPAWAESEAGPLKPEPADLSRWWEVFNDPVLNELVQRALKQNLTLQIAGLRVMEARAELGIAGGYLYPQAQQLSAGYDWSYRPNPNTGPRSIQSATVGFDAAWELDIWGKYRRGVESADANLIANVASYDDVLVSITAEVAREYVLIRSLQERIRFAEQNIKIQTRALEITQALLAGGVQSELDVQQASTVLSSTKGSVPALQISLRQAQHALSILLGVPPEDFAQLLAGPGEIPSPPVEVAVGVPTDLLRRRPDIRQAEFQAAAQCAQIGVAKAELYPSLTLLGSFGWSVNDAGNLELGDLFKSYSFGSDLGPSVSWNIFNYGQIKNNVRMQDARLQQLLVNYQNVVLRAAAEVEDAMVSFLQSKEQANYFRDGVKSSQRALDLSLIQYREGITDYQRVLDSTRSITLQQDQYVQTMSNISISLVAMYKALGGGWQVRLGQPFISPENQKQMEERTRWGKMLKLDSEKLPQEPEKGQWRKPDW